MKGVIEKSRFCNSVRVPCYVSGGIVYAGESAHAPTSRTGNKARGVADAFFYELGIGS